MKVHLLTICLYLLTRLGGLSVMQCKKYTLYSHTNKKNKKVYVGITKNLPQNRWKNGNGYSRQYFYNAICKYGWDGFEHTILADNLTRNEALRLERDYITLYDTTNPEHGYNCNKGNGALAKCIPRRTAAGTGHNIYQYDCHYNLIKIWNSMCDLVNAGYSKSSIYAICRGSNKLDSNNNRWSYEPLTHPALLYNHDINTIINNYWDLKNTLFDIKAQIADMYQLNSPNFMLVDEVLNNILPNLGELLLTL